MKKANIAKPKTARMIIKRYKANGFKLKVSDIFLLSLVSFILLPFRPSLNSILRKATSFTAASSTRWRHSYSTRNSSKNGGSMAWSNEHSWSKECSVSLWVPWPWATGIKSKVYPTSAHRIELSAGFKASRSSSNKKISASCWSAIGGAAMSSFL